jgi:hypothetical protein
MNKALQRQIELTQARAKRIKQAEQKQQDALNKVLLAAANDAAAYKRFKEAGNQPIVRASYASNGGKIITNLSRSTPFN